MSEDPRADRVSRNESVFRSVNERVEDLAADVAAPPRFICECDRPDCTLPLEQVSVEEYERVRAHPRRFLVSPGHERPEFERVIDQGPGYLVVEKVGAAGETAEEKHPRQ